jgi:hypothetical protein
MDKKLIIAALLSAMVFSSSVSYAITRNATAQINFVTSLILNTVSDINFGRILRPSNGDLTLILSTSSTLAGNVTTVPGNNTASAGEYTITALENSNISISVTQGVSSDPALSITRFSLLYDGSNNPQVANNTISVTAPANPASLMIGGDLQVGSNVAIAAHSIAYNITISYQ